MGIRDLLKYYEALSLMDEQSLIKYRKIVKPPKTNVDNFIPGDEKVILAFKELKDEKLRKKNKKGILCLHPQRFY